MQSKKKKLIWTIKKSEEIMESYYDRKTKKSGKAIRIMIFIFFTLSFLMGVLARNYESGLILLVQIVYSMYLSIQIEKEMK